jgi:osmotically-inducible protein OsmY
MKATEQLQVDVLDELAYDSAVDSSRIAVTATAEGVVTLKGSVPTHMQAKAAERAAKRVRGVRAVASDLNVNPAADADRDDAVIAAAALRALEWAASVPKDAIGVTVAWGWVTLEGHVAWDYQRRAAYDAVSDLAGVRGVTNLIEIEPSTAASQTKEQIEDAFRRNALIDARSITASVRGGYVTLRGSVSSWAEKEAAESTALSAPGVNGVDNQIAVHAHVVAG